ncbi:MAG: SIS domain-containing protein [Acidobacteriota bacterium]
MTETGNIMGFLESYLARTTAALHRLPLPRIARVIELLGEARREGRNIFVCGNGGSAATSSHFANDLGKGASVGREVRFRALSLTDNLPWITSLANDLAYDQIFVEQLRNFASPGDLLLVFSGSGNSQNVLEAVRWAREAGLLTIGFTGRTGGKLVSAVDLCVQVDSDHMGIIEDGHFVIQHLIGYFFMEQG